MAGVHKARESPTPGFVIVNTDDDGDERNKVQDSTKMKKKTEKRDEIVKMLQGIYI
jgi:hypothetical protein